MSELDKMIEEAKEKRQIRQDLTMICGEIKRQLDFIAKKMQQAAVTRIYTETSWTGTTWGSLEILADSHGNFTEARLEDKEEFVDIRIRITREVEISFQKVPGSQRNKLSTAKSILEYLIRIIGE